MLRDVRRPSPTSILSVVYSTALPCSALSVIFDDSSPKGGAKAYFHLCPHQQVLASPFGRGGNAARH